MRKEDLIKKLEQASLPEIELSEHKKALKFALLKEQQKPYITFFANKFLAPASLVAAVLLITLITVNVLKPSYSLAYVRDVANNNPEIKLILENNNAEIKDIKIMEGKAYVLLTPKEESSPLLSNNGKEFNGAFAKLDIKDKRLISMDDVIVEKISKEDEDRAKEIIEEKEFLKSKQEREIKIENVENLSHLELTEKNGQFEVLQRKELKVKYNIDYQIKEDRVNLTKD